MSWASRRRSTYLFLFFGILFLVFAGIAYSFFAKPPTCSDGKKNGAEVGIDCGGGCRAICSESALPLTVHFARSFEVLPGVHNAVAYVENANASAGIRSIPYIFKLFDERGALIAERGGVTIIPPNGITPVFEATIPTGERKPFRTQFSFTGEARFERAESRAGDLSVSDKVFTAPEGAPPRLTAILRNTSVKALANITAIAVLFDEEGNAMAASSTFVPRIEKGASEEIVFTWPRPFSAAPVRIDIIPRFPL